VKYFVEICDLRINKKDWGLRIADSNSNFLVGKSEATVPFYYIGSKWQNYYTDTFFPLFAFSDFLLESRISITLMRIQIHLFTLLRNQLRLTAPLSKWCESAHTGCTDRPSTPLLRASKTLHGSILSSWILTSIRIRIQLFTLMGIRIQI
jgi:hypothetical protein